MVAELLVGCKCQEVEDVTHSDLLGIEEDANAAVRWNDIEQPKRVCGSQGLSEVKGSGFIG